jgi:hypothetical protein
VCLGSLLSRGYLSSAAFYFRPGSQDAYYDLSIGIGKNIANLIDATTAQQHGILPIQETTLNPGWLTRGRDHLGNSTANPAAPDLSGDGH